MVGGCITSSRDAQVDHCRDLPELWLMPFKKKPVDDPVYNELIAASWDAVPGLIERSTDTTPMKDPRGGSGYVGLPFMVGSTAVLMLSRMTNVSLRESPAGTIGGAEELRERPYCESFSTADGRREVQDAWWRRYLDVKGKLPRNVLDAFRRAELGRGDTEAIEQLRAFLEISPSRRLSDALQAGDERLLSVHAVKLSAPGVPEKISAAAFNASAILTLPGT